MSRTTNESVICLKISRRVCRRISFRFHFLCFLHIRQPFICGVCSIVNEHINKSLKEISVNHFLYLNLKSLIHPEFLEQIVHKMPVVELGVELMRITSEFNIDVEFHQGCCNVISSWRVVDEDRIHLVFLCLIKIEENFYEFSFQIWIRRYLAI